jgi:hypothetical protein
MGELDSALGEDRARLQDLLAYPREDLSKEYKGWLDLSSDDDKANLAQALLAMANHGGGYVILGYRESQENQLVPQHPRPQNLSAYGQDAVNGVISKYAEPRFHCEVHHISHPESGEIFPVIKVPGGHKVPIRSRSEDGRRKHVRINTYYIRRPGPESAPPQTAREWDQLIDRCVRNARDDLLDRIRDIFHGPGQTSPAVAPDAPESDLQEWIEKSKNRWNERIAEDLPDENPSRYQYGIWTVGYSIIGDFQAPTLREFEQLLRKIEAKETGWPAWWVPIQGYHIIEPPYRLNGILECWMKDSRDADAAHSDFWRASPQGLMFLLRGYQEDCSPDKVDPGTALWLHTPIWGVGECLLHSERLAAALGDVSASVIINFKWEGLRGRTLRPWTAQKGEEIWFDYTHRTCRQENVSSPFLRVVSKDIEATLPEIVQHLTKNLYEAFHYDDIKVDFIRQELSKLRQRS